MNAQDILLKIKNSCETHTIHVVQKGDLRLLIEDYQEIKNEVKKMNNEEVDSLFQEIRLTRPLIGRLLKAQIENDNT